MRRVVVSSEGGGAGRGGGGKRLICWPLGQHTHTADATCFCCRFCHLAASSPPPPTTTHTYTPTTPHTQSELPFLNSLKMKMSILLGVTHMNLGIVMSLMNNLYFKDRLSTLCEFVPQVGGLGGCFFQL